MDGEMSWLEVLLEVGVCDGNSLSIVETFAASRERDLKHQAKNQKGVCLFTISGCSHVTGVSWPWAIEYEMQFQILAEHVRKGAWCHSYDLCLKMKQQKP